MVDHVRSYVEAPDFFVAYQGENEMICEISYCTDTDYLTALRQFIADTRAAFNAPNLPIIICQTGSITTGTGKDPQSWYVRHAHKTVATDPNIYLCCTYDLAVHDGIHLTVDSYSTIAARVANVINYLRGNSGYYRGPNCTTVAIAEGRATVTATIDKSTSTAISASGTLAEVAIVRVGDSRLYPDTTEISGSTIVFTFAFPLVFRGAITVNYATLANSGVGNYVRGNDALALPLEPFLETIQGE
jgi:hypothetical protein